MKNCVPVVVPPKRPNHSRNLRVFEAEPMLNSNRDPIHSTMQHFCPEYGTELRQRLDGSDVFRQHREVFVHVGPEV